MYLYTYVHININIDISRYMDEKIGTGIGIERQIDIDRQIDSLPRRNPLQDCAILGG
jgi:hypothetical protein